MKNKLIKRMGISQPITLIVPGRGTVSGELRTDTQFEGKEFCVEAHAFGGKYCFSADEVKGVSEGFIELGG